MLPMMLVLCISLRRLGTRTRRSILPTRTRCKTPVAIPSSRISPTTLSVKLEKMYFSIPSQYEVQRLKGFITLAIY